MRPSHIGGSGLGLALASAASFSTSGSFARSLTSAGWSPAAAVAARITIAAAVLVAPTVIAMRGRWQAVRRSALAVTIYGVLAVAGAQVFFFNAIQTLSVGVALLLEYLGIVLVVGWTWLRHGQRPRRLTVVGSVVALVGLIFILDLIGDNRLNPIGVLWGLGAAFGLAAYFVLSAGGHDDLPPVAMATGGMVVGAATLISLGVLNIMPMRATFGTVDFVGHRTSWLVPVAGLAVIAAAVAYLTGIEAARVLGPKLASFIGLAEVVFAVLFAWFLLGEVPGLPQLGGGILVIAGIVLVKIDDLRGVGDIVIAQPTTSACS